MAIDDIVRNLSAMSVTDLVRLKTRLEEEWGVSANQVFQPAPPPTIDGGGGPAVAEEKTEFTVHMASFGERKINVIKVVRELRTLDLKTAKELVESAPVDVLEDVPKERAEQAVARLREEGATVEIR
jgi:large subunit ribosomal protein L7/L12